MFYPADVRTEHKNRLLIDVWTYHKNRLLIGERRAEGIIDKPQLSWCSRRSWPAHCPSAPHWWLASAAPSPALRRCSWCHQWSSELACTNKKQWQQWWLTYLHKHAKWQNVHLSRSKPSCEKMFIFTEVFTQNVHSHWSTQTWKGNTISLSKVSTRKRISSSSLRISNLQWYKSSWMSKTLRAMLMIEAADKVCQFGQFSWQRRDSMTKRDTESNCLASRLGTFKGWWKKPKNKCFLK